MPLKKKTYSLINDTNKIIEKQLQKERDSIAKARREQMKKDLQYNKAAAVLEKNIAKVRKKQQDASLKLDKAIAKTIVRANKRS